MPITDQFGKYGLRGDRLGRNRQIGGTGTLCVSLRGHKRHYESGSAAPSALARKEFIVSLDLFMNDTCPRCRKPLMAAVIESHPTRRNLAVHKFECSNCGAVQTKILFRKARAALTDELVGDGR